MAHFYQLLKSATMGLLAVEHLACERFSFQLGSLLILVLSFVWPFTEAMSNILPLMLVLFLFPRARHQPDLV